MSGWSEGQLVSRQGLGTGALRLCASRPTVEPFAARAVREPLARNRRGLRIVARIRSHRPPENPLEFLVTEVAGGKLTPRLLGLRIGDALLVERKPQGFFTLRWVPAARDLWMVATGTGLGPFLSILKSEELWAALRARCRRARRARLVTSLIETTSTRSLARAGALAVRSRESRGSAFELLARSRDDRARRRNPRARGRASPRSRAPHVMLCGNPP